MVPFGGRSVLNGIKSVKNDHFSSAEHGSSAQILGKRLPQAVLRRRLCRGGGCAEAEVVPRRRLCRGGGCAEAVVVRIGRPLPAPYQRDKLRKLGPPPPGHHPQRESRPQHRRRGLKQSDDPEECRGGLPVPAPGV